MRACFWRKKTWLGNVRLTSSRKDSRRTDGLSLKSYSRRRVALISLFSEARTPRYFAACGKRSKSVKTTKHDVAPFSVP